MNDLTRMEPRKAAAKASDALPAPFPLEVAETALRDFHSLMLRVPCYPSSEGRYRPDRWLDDVEKAAAEARRALPAIDHHVEVIEKARRPATNAELAQHLAATISAFPNINGGVDPEMFARLLIADISALRPTVGAVEAGCRKVRRTAKYLPPISEFFSEIEGAEAVLYGLAQRIASVDRHLDQAEAWVRDERARRLEVKRNEEERRQKTKAEIRRRLEDGKDASWYGRPLVREVEAEIAAEQQQQVEVPQ